MPLSCCEQDKIGRGGRRAKAQMRVVANEACDDNDGMDVLEQTSACLCYVWEKQLRS